MNTLTTAELHRYNELVRRVLDDTEECGIKLDLNHPADRAILSECGLTEGEAFELLSLFDRRWDDVSDDDTVRVEVPLT